MNELLSGVPFARAYLNDAVVFSTSLWHHLDHLRVVLEKLSKAELKLKNKKWYFGQPNRALPRKHVSKTGTQFDQEKTKKVLIAKIPSTLTELRIFIGLSLYNSEFIKDFTKCAASVYAAKTWKRIFVWSFKIDRSFDTLTAVQGEPPVLFYLTFLERFIIETGASSYYVRAILFKTDENGNLHPIQYASRTMIEAERSGAF